MEASQRGSPSPGYGKRSPRKVIAAGSKLSGGGGYRSGSNVGDGLWRFRARLAAHAAAGSGVADGAGSDGRGGADRDGPLDAVGDGAADWLGPTVGAEPRAAEPAASTENSATTALEGSGVAVGVERSACAASDKDVFCGDSAAVRLPTPPSVAATTRRATTDRDRMGHLGGAGRRQHVRTQLHLQRAEG